MRIAVAGAGIGGLAAAALLHDAGHQVVVFDQFDQPKPLGSGLVIQPVGQAVLHKLGCRDAALHLGQPIFRMLGHAKTGRRVLDVRYDRRGDGVFGLAIQRGDLFGVLMQGLTQRGVPIETGFRVADRDSQQLVDVTGRRTECFDLIVDALGTHSPLSPMRAKHLPYGAMWGTVDWPDATDLPQDRLTQRYNGAHQMAGVLPTGQNQAAVFWSLPVTARQAFDTAGLDHWHSQAAQLWPGFEPFARQITDLSELTWAQYSHGTLRQMWSTGLVHIGDSAHRTSPQLGQGANMALLDAAALAWALNGRTGNDALRAFRSARRRHISVYQAMSWAFTPMYQSDSLVLPWLRDWVLFPASQIPPVPRILTRLVRGNLVSPMRAVR